MKERNVMNKEKRNEKKLLNGVSTTNYSIAKQNIANVEIEVNNKKNCTKYKRSWWKIHVKILKMKCCSDKYGKNWKNFRGRKIVDR